MANLINPLCRAGRLVRSMRAAVGCIAWLTWAALFGPLSGPPAVAQQAGPPAAPPPSPSASAFPADWTPAEAEQADRAAGLLAGAGGAAEMVVDVKIEGNQSISRERLLAHVRTRPGRPFDPTIIEEDVRRLNRSRLCVNVRPLTRRVQGGWLVVFQVDERPTLQEVRIIGNDRIRASALRKEVNLKPGDPLDPFAVEEGRRKIEEYYRKQGFPKARITVFEGDKLNDRRAVYVFNEGPKQKVLWTRFVGNTIASDARLRTQIQSKPPIAYLFKGEVDREQIDEDCNRLTAYYRNLGFMQAKVGRELEYNDSQDWLILTFVIHEGPRAKVRNISVVGNSKIPTEELMSELKLKREDWLNLPAMTADARKLQERYGAIGYVFADVKPEVRYLDDPNYVDLVFSLEEGDRYRVGKIDVRIKGDNPHTRLTTVLNQLTLAPGDIVDIRKLRESEKRLRSSGLFLVDPTSGSVPKIVFTPPQSDEDDAQWASRHSRHRGQSPDPPRPPAGPLTATGERLLSLEVVETPPTDPNANGEDAGNLGTDDAVPYDASGSGGGLGSAPVYRQGGLPQQSSRPISAAAAPTAVAPAPAAPVAGAAQPLVVRGQYSSELAPTDANRDRPWLPWFKKPASTTLPPPSGLAAGAPQGPAYPVQPAPAWTGNGAAPGQAVGGPTFPAVPPSSPGANPAATPYGPGTQYGTATPGAAGANFGPPTGAPATGGWNGAPQPTPPGGAAGSPYELPRTGGGWQQPGGGNVYTAPAGNTPYAAPAGAAADPWMARGTQQSPPNFGMAPGAPNVGPTYFDGIGPWGSPFNRPMDDTRPLPLIIETEETQTGRLMLGVGVNSDSGLVGSIILDEQNFDWRRGPRSWDDIAKGKAWRGGGQRLRLEAVPGTEVQRYMFTFQDPYLGGSDISFGLSGFFYDRIFQQWKEQRLGGRINLGYHLTKRLSGSLSFRPERINIRDPIDPTLSDFQQVAGDSDLYGFGATIAHDTRDSPFLATEGHLIEFSFEQVLGRFNYPHGELDLRQYFQLWERPDGSGRHVLSLTGRLGVTGGGTPIYDRYYAGGFTTIRGFGFRGVSPRKGANVAVGGDVMVLASVEYMFPITADDMLRGVIFCDTGTIQPSFSNWTEKYRISPGFGLRISIPAMGPAPLAFDFAFPVVTQPGDSEQIFSFFLGVLR